MRKLKLLLTAVALLFGVSASWAKVDVTDTYLTNADLSTDPNAADNGWTLGDGWRQDYQKATDADHVNVVEFYAGWGSLEKTAYSMKQTISLPAGYYRLAVNAFYRQGNDGNGTNADKAWIFAGEKKQNVYALGSMGELGGYTGSSDLWRASNAFQNGKYSNEFDFHLSEAQDIEIGFEGIFDEARCWVILGPVKLYEYEASDYQADFDAKVPEAKALYEEPMNATVLAALKAAAEATFSTVDEVTEGIKALNEAIVAANNSIENYKALKKVIDDMAAAVSSWPADPKTAYETAAADAIAAYTDGTATDGVAEIAALEAAYDTAVKEIKQPEDGFNMTAYIVNPNINGNTNGWTCDRWGGYSGGPLKPSNDAMEFWGSSTLNDEAAGKGFNYYQTIKGLPAGVYTISASMFQSLNGEEGATYSGEGEIGVYGLSSGKEEISLITTEGDALIDYTTPNILVYEGKDLVIGVKNVKALTARWFVVDNFKLTYVRQMTDEEKNAYVLPTNIILSNDNLSLKMFGTETLTATVEPAEANVKTVTWKSSDEKVATVNSEGLVTAVGIGSATITATSDDAPEVTASASVTVADVTAVDAPAFYSEAAAGEFYFVNAATGKYLGGANDWGTRASLIEHGLLFTVTAGEGVYALDSHTSNGGDNHFLNGTYIDQPSTGIFVTDLGDGKYALSTKSDGEYITANPSNTIVANSAPTATSVLAQWYFVSKADRDKLLATATASDPVDATYYIKEANFSRNYTGGNWVGGYSRSGANDNMVATKNTDATEINVYQIIYGLPNGEYTLKMQGCTDGTVYFIANDMEVEITVDTEVTDAAKASAAFSEGKFVNEQNVTVSDGMLKIAVKGDVEAKTIFFDNFELFLNTPSSATKLAVEVSSAKYATLVSGCNLDFTAATKIKAYTAKVDGDKVKLTQINKVAAGTPVVLYGEGTEEIPFFTGAADAATDNELKAGYDGHVATGENPVNYILNSKADIVGFYKAAGQFVARNRAYLPVAAASEGRLTIVFDDATGINAVNGEGFMVNGYYNLNGQRISQPTKGLYIQKGKKLMVK